MKVTIRECYVGLDPPEKSMFPSGWSPDYAWHPGVLLPLAVRMCSVLTPWMAEAVSKSPPPTSILLSKHDALRAPWLLKTVKWKALGRSQRQGLSDCLPSFRALLLLRASCKNWVPLLKQAIKPRKVILGASSLKSLMWQVSCVIVRDKECHTEDRLREPKQILPLNHTFWPFTQLSISPGSLNLCIWRFYIR